MSTLKVETIQSTAANTPPLLQDSAGTQIGTLCRAWVNLNGSGTVAIRSAFNVSSITDGGVGIYTLNFTNSMPSVNYAVNGTTLASTSNSLPVRVAVKQTGLATSSCLIRICSGNQDEVNTVGAYADLDSIYITIFA